MEEKKGLIERFIEWIMPGDNPVPDIVRARVKKIMILAAMVAFGGTLIMTLAQFGITSLFCLLIGLAIAAYGYFMYLSVSKKGYEEIKGECIRIDYTMTSNLPGTRNMPSRFIILDPDTQNVYALHYYKNGILVEEGDLVRIIIPANSQHFERKGIIDLTDAIGYEVVPELNEERMRRLGLSE